MEKAGLCEGDAVQSACFVNSNAFASMSFMLDGGKQILAESLNLKVPGWL